MGLLISLAMGLFVGQAISRPVRNVARVLDAVAQGDYSRRADVASRDELGRMAASLNKAVDASGKMMEEIRKSADNMDNLPTPVMTVDRDFSITYMNRTGANLLGMAPQQCTGCKCYELFKTPHCRSDQCRVGQAMQKDAVFTGETEAGDAQPQAIW